MHHRNSTIHFDSQKRSPSEIIRRITVTSLVDSWFLLLVFAESIAKFFLLLVFLSSINKLAIRVANTSACILQLRILRLQTPIPARLTLCVHFYLRVPFPSAVCKTLGDSLAKTTDNWKGYYTRPLNSYTRLPTHMLCPLPPVDIEFA